MAKNDANTGPGVPEPADPLSATGMFLRSFETQSAATEAPSAEKNGTPQAEPTLPTPAPSATPSAFGPKPGEFTQLFQSLRTESAPPATPPVRYFAPPPPPPAPASPPMSSAPGTSAAPGEFTRIFTSGAAAPASGPAPMPE